MQCHTKMFVNPLLSVKNNLRPYIIIESSLCMTTKKGKSFDLKEGI